MGAPIELHLTCRVGSFRTQLGLEVRDPQAFVQSLILLLEQAYDDARQGMPPNEEEGVARYTTSAGETVEQFSLWTDDSLLLKENGK